MAGRPDSIFLRQFREHVANSIRIEGATFVTCGCSLDSPDRECDLGYSLFSLATRNSKPVPSSVIVRAMM